MFGIGSSNYNSSNNVIMGNNGNYASCQPEAAVNDQIRQKANITTNWDYRQFLIHNASQIMKYNNQEASAQLGVNPYIQTNTTASPNVPFTFSSIMDTQKPTYGYNNSDLKAPYMSKRQVQSRMIAPSISLPKST